MAIELLGPVGTSELSTLACPRKYYFRYRQKLVPKQPNVNMAMGTVWHACAAAGYRTLRDGPARWLQAALAHSREPQIDRDGLLIELQEENLEAIRDMLTYYWQNKGRYDEFEEILVVDEEQFFEFEGWQIRFTIDLLVKMRGGAFVPIDHKTSGDIAGDMAFLPLDIQTHLYYYGVWKKYQRPMEFIHNFIRRFDFESDQRCGPPSWARMDGTKPYLYTKSGKVATRSDDVNDYLRRERTPLNEAQLTSFERELHAQLATLRFHQIADVWPRYGTKLPTGCSNCSYYAPCTVEIDGREPNPSAMALNFVKLP